MKRFAWSIFFGMGLLLTACGGSSTPAPVTTAATGLSCIASGTIGTVSISNVSVSIFGGTGPFSITLPGLVAVASSSTFYTYAGVIAGTTGTVSVTDSSTAAVTSCVIGSGGTTGGNSLVTVTTSYGTTSSLPINTAVTLTASYSGIVGGSFSFTLPTYVAGVTLTQTGSNTATITSTVAGAAPVVTVSYLGGVAATNYISLYFTSGTVNSSLWCSLTVAQGTGPYPYYQPGYIFTITPNPSVQLMITSGSSGEYSSVPTVFPIYLPLGSNTVFTAYAYQGLKTATFQVQSILGVPCNGGQPLSTTFYVY